MSSLSTISSSTVSYSTIYLVMGVSGSGKSTVAAELAAQLGLPFVDGDDLHPSENIAKMRSGQPLNDQDRLPWLARVREVADEFASKQQSAVVVCSALKRRYREQLRQSRAQLQFLHLSGSPELVAKRLRQRAAHFMPRQLLDSQFAALELPDSSEPDVLSIDIDGSLAEVVQRCRSAIAASPTFNKSSQ
ncbi:gluconokinase [Aliagarivorans taiwanensis]|uniref:gluconokinase n=1 Tax=Aliagarivorans taiwanensis TaxID=561966 RepID=UPI000683E2CF|nr:gluconokinase [Aliagarivorans taiwanensis]